jgi:hypothetical protein
VPKSASLFCSVADGRATTTSQLIRNRKPPTVGVLRKILEVASWKNGTQRACDDDDPSCASSLRRCVFRLPQSAGCDPYKSRAAGRAIRRTVQHSIYLPRAAAIRARCEATVPLVMSYQRRRCVNAGPRRNDVRGQPKHELDRGLHATIFPQPRLRCLGKGAWLVFLQRRCTRKRGVMVQCPRWVFCGCCCSAAERSDVHRSRRARA